MIEITTDTKVSGPLFDGRAEAALERGVVAIREKVANEGKKLTMLKFADSIRENHGVFEASFDVLDFTEVKVSHSRGHTYTMPVPVSDDEHAVTNDIATYGPWLEGVGSRNDTTRFKGYWGFRRATDELDLVAGDLASVELERYTEEMNLCSIKPR